MGLNIKNSEVEKLVAQVARATGVSKTEAVRQALLEQRSRMRLANRKALRRSEFELFLTRRVFPKLPPGVLGKGIPQAEQDAILGYDQD
jgi:hypothetical protein